MATINLEFRDAKRSQAKACIIVQGISGSGKSGLALAIARALTGDWQKVYAIDTENKSLDLFEGTRIHTGTELFKFKKLDLLQTYGYAPSTYLHCIENAERAGAQAIISDSITHMWQQDGGMLDIVNKAMERNPKLNRWNAWGDPVAFDEKNKIYQCIRRSTSHMISTVRMKEKNELIDGKMQSLGEVPQQMPDLKYEPDLVIEMIRPGSSDGTPPRGKITKTRYNLFKKDEEYDFTEAILDQLRAYLLEGVDPAELIEAQRQDFITNLHANIAANPSAAVLLPQFKSQVGIDAATEINDLTIDQARRLLNIIIS